MDLISTRIEANITINFPFLKHAKLLVAVSGGLDSMVAVNLLQKIGLHFGVAHCNFKLRGDESDIDAQFVKDWATKNECACFVAEFDTKNYAKLHKISIEMAARNLRYQWFHQLRVANGYDYIITAHHANDNLETTLYNFTRGTGFKGLLGIPPQNDKIIRPFLPLSREEIASYAKKNDIIWREDQSNATLEYTRNKIRHQVIPVLQKINPNLIESFQKTLSYLNDLECILKDRLEAVKKIVLTQLPNEHVSIDIAEIMKLSNPKAYLFELLKAYGFTAWLDVERLLLAQSGKQIFSASHRLIKDRNLFLISPLKEANAAEFEIDNLEEGLQNKALILTFESVRQVDLKNTFAEIVYVDATKIKMPLKVRKWQNGDYFYPLGMQGKKKLSDLFTDLKLSLLEKENTWLLCQNDEIIWVLDRRLDNRFKVTEHTKKIIKITYQQ